MSFRPVHPQPVPATVAPTSQAVDGVAVAPISGGSIQGSMSPVHVPGSPPPSSQGASMTMAAVHPASSSPSGHGSHVSPPPIHGGLTQQVPASTAVAGMVSAMPSSPPMSAHKAASGSHAVVSTQPGSMASAYPANHVQSTVYHGTATPTHHYGNSTPTLAHHGSLGSIHPFRHESTASSVGSYANAYPSYPVQVATIAASQTGSLALASNAGISSPGRSVSPSGRILRGTSAPIGLLAAGSMTPTQYGSSASAHPARASLGAGMSPPVTYHTGLSSARPGSGITTPKHGSHVPQVAYGAHLHGTSTPTILSAAATVLPPAAQYVGSPVMAPVETAREPGSAPLSPSAASSSYVRAPPHGVEYVVPPLGAEYVTTRVGRPIPVQRETDYIMPSSVSHPMSPVPSIVTAVAPAMAPAIGPSVGEVPLARRDIIQADMSLYEALANDVKILQSELNSALGLVAAERSAREQGEARLLAEIAHLRNELAALAESDKHQLQAQMAEAISRTEHQRLEERVAALEPAPMTELEQHVLEIEARGNIAVSLETGRIDVLRDIAFVPRKTTDPPRAELLKPDEARHVIDDIAEVTRLFGERLIVEGHTKGGEGSFWQSLADDRARLVGQELILRGVEPERLTTRGLPGKRGLNKVAVVVHLVDHR